MQTEVIRRKNSNGKNCGKVDGMQCGMCEAHVNEAVRSAFPVKKVTSSHAKETVILTEQDIDDAKVKRKSLTRPAMRWEL